MAAGPTAGRDAAWSPDAVTRRRRSRWNSRTAELRATIATTANTTHRNALSTSPPGSRGSSGPRLRRLGRRRRLETSLTSREILAREKSGLGREQLSILVETVERSWFGGHAVDRDAWEHCLLASQRLSASQRPSASRPLAEGGA